MARSVRKQSQDSQTVVGPESSRVTSLREANAEASSNTMHSPAQSLQQGLMHRIEAEGFIARWPALFRVSFILACAAACWTAILLPLSLL
tara:strand:- start:191 stop:460 length:270 start_codon:yes stop_codon:yes gene_type:complete